jgi:hypothetical protein
VRAAFIVRPFVGKATVTALSIKPKIDKKIYIQTSIFEFAVAIKGCKSISINYLYVLTFSSPNNALSRNKSASTE